jgi:hypothetical protein
MRLSTFAALRRDREQSVLNFIYVSGRTVPTAGRAVSSGNNVVLTADKHVSRGFVPITDGTIFRADKVYHEASGNVTQARKSCSWCLQSCS